MEIYLFYNYEKKISKQMILLTFYNCDAVSYTHLDVYKRQADACLIRPYNAAVEDPSLGWENAGYWAAPHTLSGDNIRLISYSVPLIAPDGTVYGVLGVDILEDYLLRLLPYDELSEDHGSAYILGVCGAADPEASVRPQVVSGPCLLYTSRDGIGLDGCAPGRQFIQHRDVQVSEHQKPQRAGNGRGAHHQQVGMVGLGGQQAALPHAEAVLLVRHRKAQPREFHARAQHSVSTYHQFHFTRGNGPQRGLFRRALHAARQQRHTDAQRRQQAVQRVRRCV